MEKEWKIKRENKERKRRLEEEDDYDIYVIL
jgi:hypothetical protein